MIPKRLMFIWLGSELPDYGKFCIESFKKVNPDFEIMLVNEVDMNNIKSQDLKDCISIINSDKSTLYKHLTTRNWVKKNLDSPIGSIVAISDAFRFYLLNKYGGIYLDVDTFPVNKFDDALLSHPNGFVINYRPGRYDIFFIGMDKGCVDKGLVGLPDKSNKKWFSKDVHNILYYEKLFQKIYMRRYLQTRDNFFNGAMKFGDSVYPRQLIKNYYIDHFRKETWRK